MDLSLLRGLQEPPLVWAVIFLVSLIATMLFKAALKFGAAQLKRYTNRTSSHWINAAPELMLLTRSYVLFIWSFNLLAASLYQPPFVARLLHLAVVVATTLQLILWGLRLLRFWHRSRLLPRIEHDRSSAAALSMFYTGAKATLVLTFLLIGLSHLGVNISALLTGLGIGGIAVALAAQNILGDLLASLSIILDKPFVVGDFIISGSELGTVEHIGIKTTRIRSLTGEQIILSNKDLLESRVRNFQRLERRRSNPKFSVALNTSPELLEQIPHWVEAIVKSHDLLQFDFCAMTGVTPNSFDFELAFFVNGPEYPKFLAMQQKVLLEIVERLEAQDIDLAVPTQKMWVEEPDHQARATSAFSN